MGKNKHKNKKLSSGKFNPNPESGKLKSAAQNRIKAEVQRATSSHTSAPQSLQTYGSNAASRLIRATSSGLQYFSKLRTITLGDFISAKSLRTDFPIRKDISPDGCWEVITKDGGKTFSWKKLKEVEVPKMDPIIEEDPVRQLTEEDGKVYVPFVPGAEMHPSSSVRADEDTKVSDVKSRISSEVSQKDRKRLRALFRKQLEEAYMVQGSVKGLPKDKYAFSRFPKSKEEFGSWVCRQHSLIGFVESNRSYSTAEKFVYTHSILPNLIDCDQLYMSDLPPQIEAILTHQIHTLKEIVSIRHATSDFRFTPEEVRAIRKVCSALVVKDRIYKKIDATKILEEGGHVRYPVSGETMKLGFICPCCVLGTTEDLNDILKQFKEIQAAREIQDPEFIKFKRIRSIRVLSSAVPSSSKNLNCEASNQAYLRPGAVYYGHGDLPTHEWSAPNFGGYFGPESLSTVKVSFVHQNTTVWYAPVEDYFRQVAYTNGKDLSRYYDAGELARATKKVVILKPRQIRIIEREMASVSSQILHIIDYAVEATVDESKILSRAEKVLGSEISATFKEAFLTLIDVRKWSKIELWKFGNMACLIKSLQGQLHYSWKKEVGILCFQSMAQAGESQIQSLIECIESDTSTRETANCMVQSFRGISWEVKKPNAGKALRELSYVGWLKPHVLEDIVSNSIGKFDWKRGAFPPGFKKFNKAELQGKKPIVEKALADLLSRLFITSNPEEEIYRDCEEFQ